MKGSVNHNLLLVICPNIVTTPRCLIAVIVRMGMYDSFNVLRQFDQPHMSKQFLPGSFPILFASFLIPLV